MRHKTLWIVICWLLFVALSIAAAGFVAGVPTDTVVTLAGFLSLGYVGLSKTTNIIKALRSPQGEFGFEYVEPRRDRMLWITIVWLVFIVEVYVVQLIAPKMPLPIDAVITFAGTLSVVYVSTNKGEQAAAAAGAGA